LTHGLVLLIISVAVGYAAITQGGFPGRERAFAAPVSGLSMPAVRSQPPVEQVSVLRPLAENTTILAKKASPVQHYEEAAQVAALGATPTPQAIVEDAPLRAASISPDPALPPYSIYAVVEGDTVGSIAAKYGIDAEYIIANNAEIHDSDFLTLGQQIIIPAGNGILHDVKYGETLSDIAARYDVEIDEISSFASNGIAQPDDITETQLVYVPGGALPQVTEPEPLPAPVAEDPQGVGGPPAADDAASDETDGAIVAEPSASGGLIWPVSGPISSYMGAGHPLGIDIDGFRLAGAAIAASTSGTVVFAGGNACCSYGLYVVIQSPDGIETLYGHLSSINVSAGETVSQGQSIGIIGDTGYSTGVHLHFEVIDNGTRANPLSYLP
jgi:murein DD-endopeptidase MepM/ murein hydrolase activator NlpD